MSATAQQYDVIRKPIITEKATMASEANAVVFEVAIGANKPKIKEAVEVIFEVTVTNVNTMVMPAKRGKRGRSWYVRTKQWTKAVVALAERDSIELYNL